VPESSYTYSYTPSFPSTTSESPNGTSSAGPTPTPTCTGKTYVSTQGDTCQSISKSQSISTDRLVEINNLDYACKSLVPGTNLCIDKTCETYTVKANETCQSIVKGQKFGMVQLIGWNPSVTSFSLPKYIEYFISDKDFRTIHQNCDNLGSMVGRSVCIS
jgi:LysM repeat protein